MEKSTVKQIIALWPSRKDLAQDVGVKPIAVFRWGERGRIPSKHYAAILRSAEQRGVDVSATSLIEAQT